MTHWLIVAVLVAPLAAAPARWGVGLAETKTFAVVLLAAFAGLWRVRNPWVRAFAAWTVISYVLAGAHGWALSGLLGVLAWVVLYEAARGLDLTAWRRLRLALVLSVAGQLAWLGVQLANLDPIFFPIDRTPGIPMALVGWFGNAMDLSLFLGLALPLLAAVHPLLALAPALAMLLALRTTVGTVAIVVTAIWLLTPRRASRWLRAAVVGAVALVGLAYVVIADPQGAGQRPLVWAQAAQLVQMRPVTGWGPNAVDHRVIILTPVDLRWNFLFNEWLQVAVEMGVLAPLCAAGYLGSLLLRLRGRVQVAGELVPALIIIVLASLFSIPFRSGPAALLTALIVGQLERRLA